MYQLKFGEQIGLMKILLNPAINWGQ